MTDQMLVPGIVGISTYVDYVYHLEMQTTARCTTGAGGPVNQLRTVTATLNFNLLVQNLRAGRKDDAEKQVEVACLALERAGADFVVVTSGTTSTLVQRARQRLTIPFLDLADACWAGGALGGPVGLLCTKYAAAGGVFQEAAARRRTELVLPRPETVEEVDNIIFGELVCGDVSERCLRIIGDAIKELGDRGAAAVILGNTDLTLAAKDLQESTRLPLIDAARFHARSAARTALSGRLEAHGLLQY